MFENRKLKREIAVLSDENDELRRRLKTAETMSIAQTKYNIETDRQLRAVKENYADCQKELEELKNKVRMQNEADLMFVSVKIIVELLKGKKTEDVATLNQDLSAYARAYNNAQQQRGQANGLNSLLQTLGL